MNSSDFCPRLFVYGTLRRGFSNPHAQSLSEAADWLGSATIPGRLYRVSWFPAAIPDCSASTLITGDVFHLHDPKTTLTQLDRYEGIAPHLPEPHEYVREIVTAQLGHSKIECWCYRWNRPVDGLELIPSGVFVG